MQGVRRQRVVASWLFHSIFSSFSLPQICLTLNFELFFSVFHSTFIYFFLNIINLLFLSQAFSTPHVGGGATELFEESEGTKNLHLQTKFWSL
jgi:hypothetical protein